MKFKIVPDDVRDKVLPPRNVRSEFMQALIDGKTITIAKEDRNKIGGHHKTLNNHGLRLRSGMISETEIAVWAEPLPKEE